MTGAISSKVATLVWWLRHPRLYPEMMRDAGRKLISRENPAETRRLAEGAREWCGERAADADTVIRRIAGCEPSNDFTQAYREELEAARRREEQCPVEMGGAGNLDLVYHMAEFTQATRAIETGVAYGWSSLAILLSLHKREGSLLISTDRPYPRTHSERYAGCVVPDELRSNWQLLKYADREALPKALRRLPVIDLCHYDSDKSREGRVWAYPKLWNALRPGGVFVSDDIDDDFGFRDFCKSVDCEPYVVHTPQQDAEKSEKFVGVLVKPKS